MGKTYLTCHRACFKIQCIYIKTNESFFILLYPALKYNHNRERTACSQNTERNTTIMHYTLLDKEEK